MGITFLATIVAFGIFFVYYPKVYTATPKQHKQVLISLCVCLFFAFFGPFMTGEF